MGKRARATIKIDKYRKDGDHFETSLKTVKLLNRMINELKPKEGDALELIMRTV